MYGNCQRFGGLLVVNSCLLQLMASSLAFRLKFPIPRYYQICSVPIQSPAARDGSTENLFFLVIDKTCAHWQGHWFRERERDIDLKINMTRGLQVGHHDGHISAPWRPPPPPSSRAPDNGQPPRSTMQAGVEHSAALFPARAAAL